MTSFGENLKKFRSDKNLSQGELSKLVGMHSTHISRYERNLASPTVEALKKIAHHLEVSVDVLVFGKESERASNQITDQDLLRLFSKAQSLEQNDMECIKSLLEAYLFKKDMQQRLAV